MTATESFLYVVGLSLIIGAFSGWMVQKSGYSFWQYFVTGFIASCGILGIIFKILSDYL